MIELMLCSKVLQKHYAIGVRDDTLITAEVLVAESSYYIELKPTDEGLLKLTALDDKEKDVTDFYRTLISHCTEQDAIDNFDGRDDSFPLRLCWYRGYDGYEVPKDLHSRSNYVVSTKTFRSHLIRYIKAFEHESINNIKNYEATEKHGVKRVQVPIRISIKRNSSNRMVETVSSGASDGT